MSDGYDFVPLTPNVLRKERSNNRHDRRIKECLQIVLALEFRTDEPIHVGTGSRSLREGQVLRESAHVSGGLGIPGASVRGVLRARFEAITKSCCVSRAPLNTRSKKGITSRTYDGYQVAFSQSVVGKDVFSPCRSRETCLACAVFGTTGMRSRLGVHDFSVAGDTRPVTQNMPQLFSPRPHHLGVAGSLVVDREQRLLTVKELRGRKFHGNGGAAAPGPAEQVEAIPAGTALAGQMSVVNGSPEELGALLTAIGWKPQSFLKIGSGKAHGFGRVTLHKLHAQVREFTTSREASETELSAWREAFAASTDRWQDGENKLVDIHRIGVTR